MNNIFIRPNDILSPTSSYSKTIQLKMLCIYERFILDSGVYFKYEMKNVAFKKIVYFYINKELVKL